MRLDTGHLVDPELLPLLAMTGRSEFSDENLAEIRAGMIAMVTQIGAPPLEPVRHEAMGPAGPVPIYLYDPAPESSDRPALLHIHGGGMVVGSAAAMQAGPAAMALSFGIPVASVEYRLAPEHPFPAPQEDCLAALHWLADSAAGLGIDPGRIGVIGESAGGGLAAATAQMARDTGGPVPAAQFLVYPMLDHRTGGEDCPYRNRHTGEFIWTREANRYGWGALRGDYAANDARKGWFSPSLADDLAGMPPTWIGTGSLDLFLDEDLDYARRLIDAGVPVELHCYAGAIHGFNMLPNARLTQIFGRDLADAVRRQLG